MPCKKPDIFLCSFSCKTCLPVVQTILFFHVPCELRYDHRCKNHCTTGTARAPRMSILRLILIDFNSTIPMNFRKIISIFMKQMQQNLLANFSRSPVYTASHLQVSFPQMLIDYFCCCWCHASPHIHRIFHPIINDLSCCDPLNLYRTYFF